MDLESIATALERGAAAERALEAVVGAGNLVLCGMQWWYKASDGNDYFGPTPLDAYLASPDGKEKL